MKALSKLVLIILGLLVSCAPVRTRTNYDQKIDFSKYQSFCWLRGCEFVYEGPEHYRDSVALNNIRDQIIVELKSKGLVQDQDNPDLLIDFHVIIEEQTAMIARHPEYREDYEQYDPVWEEYQYLRGTLIIDMVDNSQSRMIWRSHSVGFLETFPQIGMKQIEKSVKEALKDFPPEN